MTKYPELEENNEIEFLEKEQQHIHNSRIKLLNSLSSKNNSYERMNFETDYEKTVSSNPFN